MGFCGFHTKFILCLAIFGDATVCAGTIAHDNTAVAGAADTAVAVAAAALCALLLSLSVFAFRLVVTDLSIN